MKLLKFYLLQATPIIWQVALGDYLSFTEIYRSHGEICMSLVKFQISYFD